jgi:phospholipid/cholesterol/gamma-HCH transport system substrate-binding protein
VPLRRSKMLVLGAGVLLAAVVAPSPGVFGDDSYELKFLMPAASGIVEGTPVQIAGRDVGKVTDLSVEGNAAQVTVSVDESRAPLPAGTEAQISWNSMLGHRVVELTPGDEKNAAIPSGKVVEGSSERVELDDLVAALDAPTRKRVRQVVAGLQQVISDNDEDLRRTLTSAGPFVDALGEVLAAVGRDGPAIRRLVTRLRRITSTLAARDRDLGTTVTNLSELVGTVVDQQQHLRTALDEVSTTVDAGNSLFSRVPDAVAATLPLLEDLRPATDRLPAVARRLNPVLSDLRPVVHELRPTLAAARVLLGETPALLRTGSATLPDADSAVTSVQPAMAFLRPYTPEVIGFLTNWTSLFSAKNAAGHFGRAMVPVSATSFNSNPGVLPPGLTQWEAPAPGLLAGQSWTDANGDGVR